jgi:hypothetical protein
MIAKGSGEIYTYNGIDRLDSTKGYTADNCVPCAGNINIAKQSLSVEEFVEMCHQVAEKHPRMSAKE